MLDTKDPAGARGLRPLQNTRHVAKHLRPSNLSLPRWLFP